MVGAIEFLGALLQPLRIAVECRKLRQNPPPQTEAPIGGTFHLLLGQFEICVGFSLSKEPLAVAHLETPLDAEPLAIGIGFQHQQRRVGRDDVEFLGQGDDVVANCRAAPLLQQEIELRAGPEPRDE